MTLPITSGYNQLLGLCFLQLQNQRTEVLGRYDRITDVVRELYHRLHLTHSEETPTLAEKMYAQHEDFLYVLSQNCVSDEHYLQRLRRCYEHLKQCVNAQQNAVADILLGDTTEYSLYHDQIPYSLLKALWLEATDTGKDLILGVIENILYAEEEIH